jgi:hypothetical protein
MGHLLRRVAVFALPECYCFGFGGGGPGTTFHPPDPTTPLHLREPGTHGSAMLAHPAVLLLGALKEQASRSAPSYSGTNDTAAFVITGGKGVRRAFRILIVDRQRALRIRHAGPATPVDAGKVGAPLVRITSLSVSQARGPDRGAATSVAKAVAALAIVCATACRHVLGPGSRGIILRDSLVDRRALESRRRLTRVGERRGVLQRCWCHRYLCRMFDAPPRRRVVG